MQITSGLHCLQNAMTSPICATEKDGRVAYPFERWIVTSFVFSLIALRMPSKSNVPSGRRSTCRYETPYSFSEHFDSRMPMTSSSVS